MELEDNLREMAEELRKVAAQLPEELQKEAEELDPEKVRDFLVFMGTASRMWS